MNINKQISPSLLEEDKQSYLKPRMAILYMETESCILSGSGTESTLTDIDGEDWE